MERKKPAAPIKDEETVLDIQDYLKYKNERDYILLVLGITTGFRAGDLVKLRVRDIKKAIQYGEIEILEGKKVNTRNIRKENIKPRIVPIVDNLKRVLKAYIRDKKDYDFMFPSRKGKHISVAHVSRILKEAGEQFELNNISAHSMRKTYAYTLYMENDKDIVAIKEMLGHSSTEITKRYLGLDKELYNKYSKKLNNLIR